MYSPVRFVLLLAAAIAFFGSGINAAECDSETCLGCTCTWCQSVSNTAAGTCQADGKDCEDGKFDAAGLDNCAYQAKSCAICTGAGGVWGEVEENNSVTQARCFADVAACEALTSPTCTSKSDACGTSSGDDRVGPAPALPTTTTTTIDPNNTGTTTSGPDDTTTAGPDDTTTTSGGAAPSLVTGVALVGALFATFALAR